MRRERASGLAPSFSLCSDPTRASSANDERSARGAGYSCGLLAGHVPGRVLSRRAVGLRQSRESGAATREGHWGPYRGRGSQATGCAHASKLIAHVGRWCLIQRSVRGRQPTNVDGGLAISGRSDPGRAKRHQNPVPGGKAGALGATLERGPCRREAPRVREAMHLSRGCGGASLGVHPSGDSCESARRPRVGATGVPVTRPNGPIAGKTTPCNRRLGPVTAGEPA